MASDKRLDQVKLVNSAESVLVVNGDQVEKAALAGFANSMGSSVPLQQTSEQVSITGLYARTSDGKMVELTKESVAQVMADITVGIVKKGGFGGDLDTLTEEGMYRVRDSITNNPEGVYYDAPIFVFKSLSLITQVIVIPASGGMVMRTKISNGWSSWNRIDNFGYNTLAELSSGVAEQMGYIGKKSYALESGQEVSTGFTGAGAYVIFNASAGRSSLVVSGAIVLDAAAILYNDADISHSLSASNKVCFNRKSTNGEFFLKNNYTSSLNLIIIPL